MRSSPVLTSDRRERPVRPCVARDVDAGTDTEAGSTRLLRGALVGLATVAMLGVGAELAMERHWDSTIQLIPWVALAVLAAATIALVARPAAWVVLTVRLGCAAAAVSGAFGVYEHVRENFRAGPLDFRYTTRWPTMSTASRWWAAATKAVGPAPTLAPGALALVALCLCLATIRHPALARGRMASNDNTIDLRSPARVDPEEDLVRADAR